MVLVIHVCQVSITIVCSLYLNHVSYGKSSSGAFSQTRQGKKKQAAPSRMRGRRRKCMCGCRRRQGTISPPAAGVRSTRDQLCDSLLSVRLFAMASSLSREWEKQKSAAPTLSPAAAQRSGGASSCTGSSWPAPTPRRVTRGRHLARWRSRNMAPVENVRTRRHQSGDVKLSFT